MRLSGRRLSADDLGEIQAAPDLGSAARPAPLRELKKSLGTLGRGSSITARVLSRELKSLAASGLIERRDLRTVPPHVEYTLSPLGRSLIPVIATMQAWGLEHLVERPIAV